MDWIKSKLDTKDGLDKHNEEKEGKKMKENLKMKDENSRKVDTYLRNNIYPKFKEVEKDFGETKYNVKLKINDHFTENLKEDMIEKLFLEIIENENNKTFSMKIMRINDETTHLFIQTVINHGVNHICKKDIVECTELSGESDLLLKKYILEYLQY